MNNTNSDVGVHRMISNQNAEAFIESEEPDSSMDCNMSPSPLRVRNSLTLEEKVRAIKAYDENPMYTKVARMFNCCWEQIKTIVANRDAIMKFYKNSVHTDVEQMGSIRDNKLAFLEQCLYEYIQRMQYHTKHDLTVELIRVKANEFRDLIEIENFSPTKGWLNHFKFNFNFSLANRQLVLTRIPPASLDLKDIMTYCSKKANKNINNTPGNANTSETISSKDTAFCQNTMKDFGSTKDAALEEINRRNRKLNFLEQVLLEFMKRASLYFKDSFTDDLLLTNARELRDLLKLDDFEPGQEWLDDLKKYFWYEESQKPSSKARRIVPLTLDLKDIVSFCSRQNSAANTSQLVSLQPKDKPQEDKIPPFKKIRLAISPNHEVAKLTDVSEQIIDVDKDNDEDEDDDDDVIIIESDDKETTQPSNDQPGRQAVVHKIRVENATPKPQTIVEVGQLPKQIRSSEDAMKFLKPLEEYALLTANFRAIGLLTQLDQAFANCESV